MDDKERKCDLEERLIGFAGKGDRGGEKTAEGFWIQMPKIMNRIMKYLFLNNQHFVADASH